MKEFRLSLTLPLPDDKFAEANLIAQIEEPLTAFLKALPDGCKVEHDVVTPPGSKKVAHDMVHTARGAKLAAAE